MEGQKKSIPKWGIIVICVLVVLVILGLVGGDSDDKTKDNNTNDVKENKVTVTDFSNMTKADIDTWCDENKVKCIVKSDYSDTVAKDGFIKQSVEANKSVYEGETITIEFSLGKEPTTEQKNALRQAESYSKNLHMSKQAIYDQLTSEYGGKFPAEAAQYAIDNVSADWNANALASAKSYQQNLSMSKNAIYDQLVSQYGGKFTKEQAQYAVDHLDD